MSSELSQNAAAEITLCLTFNYPYKGYASTLLESIAINLSKDARVHVAILTDCKRVLASDPSDLIGNPQFSVTMYDVEEELSCHRAIGRFPPLVFARFLIPKYLSGRVIYLDVDIIAVGCISELHAVDFQEQPIAAALDRGFFLQQLRGRYQGFHPRYINAGVIVLDASSDYVRSVFDSSLRLARSKPMRLADQDALNFVLNGRVTLLPDRFNRVSLFLSGRPVLVHFAIIKPTTLLSFFPSVRLFFSMAKLCDASIELPTYTVADYLKKMATLCLLPLSGMLVARRARDL